jgi:hypothetical protein
MSPGLSGDVIAEVRTGRALGDVGQVQVQSKAAIPVRVVVRAAGNFVGMSLPLVHDVGSHGVNPESLGHDHVHALDEEALVEHRALGDWTGGVEVEKSADGVLALERESLVLEPGVDDRSGSAS